jgi:hypothetical protein
MTLAAGQVLLLLLLCWSLTAALLLMHSRAPT